MRIGPRRLILFLAMLLPAAVLGSLLLGTVTVSASSFFSALTGLLSSGSTPTLESTILFDIRLPRILLALCVGAILATSGAVMQGLFRNPLADPSLIGVSSGASVGASIVIVIASAWMSAGSTLGISLVALGAFAGGFIATLLVYRLATSEIGTSVS